MTHILNKPITGSKAYVFEKRSMQWKSGGVSILLGLKLFLRNIIGTNLIKTKKNKEKVIVALLQNFTLQTTTNNLA